MRDVFGYNIYKLCGEVHYYCFDNKDGVAVYIDVRGTSVDKNVFLNRFNGLTNVDKTLINNSVEVENDSRYIFARSIIQKDYLRYATTSA